MAERAATYDDYPEAIEGPEAPPYCQKPGSNPILSGLSLTVAATAVTYIPALASFLYRNGGFDCLQNVPELINYEPRYDPTVVRTHAGGEKHDQIDVSASDSYVAPNKGVPYTRIGDFHAVYKAGKITPTEVVEVILGLVKTDPQFKSTFLSVKRDEVIAAAKAATSRFKEGKPKGMLDGVPVAIKDEVNLEGHPQTLGTAMNFANPQTSTSWCVRKWQEAGAIIIGKLNMHEYGLDTSGNNPLTGIPTNPHNPSYYPGGSSSASATTVSSNLLPLTLGGDGGGSIRIPSAYCGIYGLKPTHNRVGRSPTVAKSYSTGVVGPMASCMADLELGYRVMATPDPNDKASSRFAAPTAASASSTPQKRVLGICKAWFEASDPAVLSLCHEALDYYRAQGWEIVDIAIPYLHEAQTAHALTISTEAGCSVPAHSIRFFSAANRIIFSVFGATPASDFLRAQKLRNLLMQHLASLWQKHPGMLLVTPTAPNAGWKIGPGEVVRGVSDGNMSVKSMRFIWLANFLGCPAISVPIGKAEGKGSGGKGEGKVPVGLMAMGEWGDEEGCLGWGQVAEEWVWGGGEKRMERPSQWVDILEMAGAR